MTGAATVGGAPAAQTNLYSREVRFGVVMYGGVSLAIYINGVTNELYEMACATPKGPDEPFGRRTRDVYRKASWLLHDKDLAARYLAHQRHPDLVCDPFDASAAAPPGQRTRFVVDTIAGTSAGGINGLFLAKALANGQEFAPLKRLWIQEGDIDGLLNDRASYEGLEYARTDSPPQSLLNSDRMYVKLVEAFQGMTKASSAVDADQALVDEIDLFITTTDIRGAVVPLRLFDKVVYEKRYKQVYHFQAPHFADKYIPFLAFAARCTSSFPFAFEPMSVADAQRLYDARPTGGRVDFDEWKPFFTGLSAADIEGDRWRKRAFGDGGYLDNKPFSYVVDALSSRLGGLPMERKLIYVEPSPTNPELERQNYDRKPDAIENALGALFTIPQDETIREDLEAVLKRNRRIERVERIVRQVEIEMDVRDDERDEDPFARIELDKNNKVPPWRSRDLRDMVRYYGAAFLPYRHLRMMTATDHIAERLADWWGVDRQSDRLYALKAMARLWREARYYENREEHKDRSESVNAFLEDYDIKYYLRRASFILRKVHQLRSLVIKFRLAEASRDLSDIEEHLRERWEGIEAVDPASLLDALVCLADGLGIAIDRIRKAIRLQSPGNTADERKELDQVLCLLLGEGTVSELTAEDGATVGATVRVSDDLPTPSPLRTLQENVFKRAQKLFQYALGAGRTRLQKLLEGDIELMRGVYEKAVHPPLPTDLSVHALLGKPRLVPKLNQDQREVIIEIGDVEVLGYEACLNTDEGRALRKFLAAYYMRFDEYDQVSFPLYYDTGTGEPSTVEVVRISPEDASSLINERNEQGTTARQRHKLAGTALFHFGAFLDAQWRRNDIMWGRLDGCERILATLFPAPDQKSIREGLLREAQRTIVREEMQPEGYGELIDRFADALAEQKNATLEGAFDALWGRLSLTTGGQRRTQIAEALKAVLGDEGMLNYVRDHYEVDRKLDTGATLRTSARALAITGQMLEESEKRHRLPFSRMVWVARGGRALQALLTVSTPGSLSKSLYRHWLVLLYVFEAVIIGGALLLSAEPARTFGLTALAVTFVLHMASLITGDLIVGRGGWLKAAVVLLAFMLLVLAVLGLLALHSGGFRAIACSGSPEAHELLRWGVCKIL